MHNNSLKVKLLDDTDATSGRIKIRAEGGSIVFYVEQGVNTDVPVPPSLAKKIFYLSTLSFVMITKCAASSGMMVFSEKDLLENPDYIFWDGFFHYLPTQATSIIIAFTVFSDTFMNMVTRGAATAKMLRALLYSNSGEGSHVRLLSGAPALKAAKATIIFCGGLSSVTASLVAFLGAVTLCHYLTDDLWILMTFGSVVAAANFIANISYRIDKSVDNFVKCLNGELTYPYLTMIVSFLGSAAFLGTCYYGTGNAIRKLLDLLHVYAGDPDSGTGCIASYERWINGATDATLPFAIISYFFSSCVPMFPQTIDPDPRPKVKIPLRDVVLFVDSVKDTEHYKALKFYQRDYWYPEALKLFCVTMMPFFVLGALVGSILPTFNSSNGLIIHMFFGQNMEFSDLQAVGIALVSALLTLVFSKIFWSFNVIDWFSKVEEFWLTESLRVMEKAGVYHPRGELADLQERINEAVAESGSILTGHSSWISSRFARLWSPRQNDEILYKLIDDPLLVVETSSESP